MSTYSDMSHYVAWIESHWGHAKSWANWKELQEDFLNFTPGAVMETLYLLFRSGLKYPPGPSEVIKAVGPIQAKRMDQGVDPVDRSCHGTHRWADPLPYDVDRHRSCVLCGESGGLVKCEHHSNLRGSCVYCLDDVGMSTGGSE